MDTIASKILSEVNTLKASLEAQSITQPSLARGAESAFWSTHSEELTATRTRIFGLTKQLNKTLYGPHGFLHEYVSTNWEYGALYTVLEFGILEMIPFEGCAKAADLAERCKLPVNKLLRVLRLVACEDILNETSNGVFEHTAISETLVKDENFRNFVGFQLYETRIASAHLADSLKQMPNGFEDGQSAFNFAWGSRMYDWYKTHPEKAVRFDKAMEGVAASLDPGNALFLNYFTDHPSTDKDARNLIVDVGGGNGHVARSLATQLPELHFSVQDLNSSQLDKGRASLPASLASRVSFVPHDMFAPRPDSELKSVRAYVLRNVLWNWSDADSIKALQTFVPVMEQAGPGEVALLINDGISPPPGMFDKDTEKAFRRRDVTTMTMHNTKQRTEEEWRDVLGRASPHFKLSLKTAFSSHSYRGLWEVTWVLAN